MPRMHNVNRACAVLEFQTGTSVKDGTPSSFLGLLLEIPLTKLFQNQVLSHKQVPFVWKGDCIAIHS